MCSSSMGKIYFQRQDRGVGAHQMGKYYFALSKVSDISGIWFCLVQREKQRLSPQEEQGGGLLQACLDLLGLKLAGTILFCQVIS